MEITQAAVDTMLLHAREAHPRECCGLLLGRAAGSVENARPSANTHPDPETHFEIDPAALFRAHREERDGGPALLGYYHSHPSGSTKPSAEDARRAAPDGRVWLITDGHRLSAYLADHAGIQGRFRPITLNILRGS